MDHVLLLQLDGLNGLKSEWRLFVIRKKKSEGQEAEGFALIDW